MLKIYDGTYDVRKFIAKAELEAALKNHADEKKAQYIASKLVGPAMDVYLRMSAADQKDPELVKAELLKEFERGQLNREEAITSLDQRKRLPKESAENFRHKIIELVKLAYPTFTDNVRESIAKDYFVRGLSQDLQIAVKSVPDFSAKSIKEITAETVRLELAGVGEKSGSSGAAANSCENMVDAIADRVIERLERNRICSVEEDDTEVHNVGGARGGYRGRGRDRNRGRGRGNNQQNRSQRKCRACQEPGHIVKDCPRRFCQACGGRGHDQYNASCPNYQL